MTVTLPVDADTARLAQKLAEATGQPLPLVVKQAIEHAATEAGVETAAPPRLDRSELLALMAKIVGGFDKLPVFDDREPDEILGYTENGLPL